MTLDPIIRGKLEQTIDNVKQVIQKPISSFDEKKRVEMNVKNKEDFALGLALGIIIQDFYNQFFFMYTREPNQQEILEVASIIYRRIAEIRNAISNIG
jgi:hypothetical protein